ncbi:UNVERIFIED_ORG: aldehyde dehydrogenase (NAD+) [Nocardia globerula]|uniref:Aldehyde dehydrogenase (NAD+) n=1 Tax=Nocardia globerula TaxID=1818 RepID=A0A652YSH4_NOCGL|nr:aldehyde dehydrogenase family protein [Rhodococcus globerulus]NMD61418.1 aldehyde dehydrogenase family protein [Nocardia globerula]PVX67032.1 aldehyde dehydrogenase (NAD+) [Rhodococcus globerulus]
MSASQSVSVIHEERFLLDGKMWHSGDGSTFDVVNPATGEVVGCVADATAGDMDAAIAASRRAFDTTSWSTDLEFRQRCLRQLHEAIMSEVEELRHELVTEVGAPLMTTYMAQLDWPLSEGLLWPAEAVGELSWHRRLPDSPLLGMTSMRHVFKESVGVVAAIVPWNFPFEILINKIGPILATGNTVVVKAASETPWNATRVGRLIAEKTDIPAGVVNIITTSDVAVAQQLVTDPRVDMISFTGSTRTGQLIAEKSAPTFKRLLLELGGKSAGIILDDADLGLALPSAMSACMHAGQGCALPTRLLVHRSRYDEAIVTLEQVYAAIPYGDPTDPGVFSGPVISEKQRTNILDLIKRGEAEGGRLIVGGKIPEDQPNGFFIQPTLFADVDNSATISQAEIFGPVLSVTPFDDDADAIRLANDSVYGLSGNVFTSSPERALAIARGVRTGSFMINGGMFYGADSPYGGYKHSGIGRQGGIEGLETYLETKAVASTLPLDIP